MMLFLKKKNDDDMDKAPPVPVITHVNAPEQFIPYYCHYNPHTLLTKNGELMQTIRIASNTQGLDYEGGGDAQSSVRETIRSALQGTVHTDILSVWIHTFRKRRDVRYDGEYNESFADYVHNEWREAHHWKFQYHNEVYVTLLHDGQATKLFDSRAISKTFLVKNNRTYRNAYLDDAYKELDSISSAILEKIRVNYNAQRLSVVERIPAPGELGADQPPLTQPIFYSEPMEFLGTVLNLRSGSYPLPEADISEMLAPHQMTFGFNALETKDADEKKRFAAILTLKEYREIPPDTSDRILQAPMEFIISQAFRFVPYTDALGQYKTQKDLLDYSGDLYAMKASGISDMLASNRKQPTDFGEVQTSIMVMADDFRLIDAEAAKVREAFAELGLITVREDIRLEDCFWAQLPGNFEFIRRRDMIATARVGGFARLNRFPCGNENGNHWGDAVTLIPTTVNSPYFFNFHYQDNGHTAVFDFNSFNDHASYILMNFLMCESRKFHGRITVFDHNRSARLFFNKMGGDYHHFPAWTPHHEHPEAPPLRLNPFSLNDTPRNRSFLLAWCSSLIVPDLTLADEHKASFRTAIDALYAEAPEHRHMARLAQHVAAVNPPLAGALGNWMDGGTYGGLWGDTETLDISQPLHGFDMLQVTQHPDCVIPVFSYLLHRFIAAIDGKPQIIVLHDAITLLENPFFAPRLESLMEMLQQNNVMVIFTVSEPAEHTDTNTFRVLMKQCATRLYIPSDVPVNYTAQEMEISESDSRLLNRMDRQKGDFMLKQHHETVGLRCNLRDLDDIHAIFSNDPKNLSAAGGPFAVATPKMYDR